MTHKTFVTNPQYLAGIIDGEGSLMLDRKTSKHSTKVNYIARMAIATTSRLLVDKMLQDYPFLSCNNIHKVGKHSVDAFTLFCGEGVLKELLPELIPHLVIKKAQAETLLKFLAQKEIDMHDYEALELFKIDITHLNARGNKEYAEQKFKENAAKWDKTKAEADRKALARQAELDARSCAWCSTSMKGKHYHAKYCSNACTLKAWRASKKEEGAGH